MTLPIYKILFITNQTLSRNVTRDSFMLLLYVDRESERTACYSVLTRKNKSIFMIYLVKESLNMIHMISEIIESSCEKANNVVYEQARHKSGCTVTEAG